MKNLQDFVDSQLARGRVFFTKQEVVNELRLSPEFKEQDRLSPQNSD